MILLISAVDHSAVSKVWRLRGSHGGHRSVCDLSGWWGALGGVTKHWH